MTKTIMYMVAYSVEEVNELLKDWWVCQWWCQIIPRVWKPVFFQAMIKDPIKEKKKPTDKSIDENLRKFVNARNAVEQIWSAKWFKTVRVITANMQKEWSKLVSEFKDLSLIEDSIWSYIDEIGKRAKREWSDYHLHRFTFEQFIKQQNGARKFINS